MVEEENGELIEEENWRFFITDCRSRAVCADERAVEDFKGSAEIVQMLKDQHRKSVTENTNLYRTRGWLNVEKFRADRAAALAKRAEEEQERAGLEGQESRAEPDSDPRPEDVPSQK